MTSHMDRPTHLAPAPWARCEAVAKPAKGGWQKWNAVAHRCCRRAVQVVGERSLCWQHANLGKVEP